MAPIHDLINPTPSTSNIEPSKSNDSKTSNYEEITRLFPEINKEELVKLMIQTLNDLGYQKSSQELVKESGLSVDSPNINNFIKSIHEGQFDIAIDQIPLLNLIEEDNEESIKQITYLILREKFLEKLFDEKSNKFKLELLQILRGDIQSILNDSKTLSLENIKPLTAILMNKDSQQLQLENGWYGNIDKSRDYLLNEISKYVNPNEMIPKFRLFKLLEQSLDYQKYLNLFNFPDLENKSISLYEDLKWDKSNFPNTVVKALTYHQDEVWYVLFSHDGSKLVSTSADKTVIVYDVNNNLEILYHLKSHEKQVMYASFSPDDSKLITCSIESKAILWDLNTGEEIQKLQILGESRIWCCDWINNEEFILGSPDKEFCLYSATESKCLYKWSGPIINDLKVTKDNILITATYEKEIEVWDLSSRHKIKTLRIGERITSVSVSQKNPNLVLINVSPNEVQLWDWNQSILLNKYIGHNQVKYIIRSCFGHDENLVLSGSEDGRIFLWNKEFGALIGTFKAHDGNTNCVTWNPIKSNNKEMFVTCGDDGLVKVWGPSKKKNDF
ncbi:hypothetical protein WICMUC_003049 [Wickerhamomyces mucosus]|uniref:Uncharacterized protein n=1 Tax=Wickerhamomyces mucosus TaxID=1378264 RepID=A0A9P8PMN5_9ASCO|nr:hypothetical protein WICMUC_003049 [Wickerhamomyces mucosus]